MLIEVDITLELKNSMTIRDPKGNKIAQPVDYEWKPPFCSICKKVGHESKEKKKHNQIGDRIRGNPVQEA